MDRFSALKAFTRVVEAGSFTRAADSLDMPNATLSKTIKQLEAHLGVSLLQRTTRRITVTPEGREYYEKARCLLEDLEEIDASFNTAHNKPKGHLRIAIGGSTACDVLIPLLAVTLDTLDEKLTKTRRRILAALTIAWGVLFVAVCRAIGAGAGDNTLLQWFDFVADRTDRLPVLGQGAWLAVWRAVIAVGVAVLGVLLVRRRGRRVLAGAALVLCVLCYAGEWRINRWTYEVPAGTAQQASALNDALAELDGRILFVPYGVRQRDSQLIETYVARDVYIVEYETLLQSGALADGVLDLTAEAVGPEYPGRAYTDLDTADWVLAADGVPVDTSALEKADAACPAGYVLYRNLDAQRVRFAVS